MSNNNQNTIDKPKETFKILINQYLDTNIEEDIPLKNLIKKITDKKNSDKITNIERNPFQLIESVNPLTEKFRLELGIFFSLNTLKYLKETKAKNAQANAEEVYRFFCHNLIELKETSMAEIFFKKEGETISNIELYLELVIAFITSNQVDLIINILKDKLPEKEIDLIKDTLDGLNLKNNKSYMFVKDILLKITNRNPELELMSEINIVKENYLKEEKNEFLHCKICYNPPILELNDEKKIIVKYLCNHVKEADILNPENIKNYEIKCISCDQILLNIYKNCLCSNCKNIVCNKCLQKHFNECLTLFFIPLIDNVFTCTEHNKHFELFCSICNLNLCSNCKDEHHHYSQYGLTYFSKEDKIEIKNIINKDTKNNKIILGLIEHIISSNQYLKNLQYQYFLEKLLGREINKKCGIFNEFGDKNFNEYYSNLIDQRKKGNLFYIDVYNSIKDSYEKENKKINDEQINQELLYKKAVNSSKIDVKNSNKKTLLIKVLLFRKDIQKEISIQKMKLKEDIMNLRMAKYEIKNNALLNGNNRYKSNIIKLINRSIADNIIRYLVFSYPSIICHNYYFLSIIYFLSKR